jgi:UDP-glucuronate decarboxylase
MGYDHVIPQLFQRALKAEHTLEVYSADHRRAFCYVTDATEMCIRAMRHPETRNTTLNVGNDREDVTIGELARQVVGWSGKNLSLVPVPAEHDPIRHRCPNIDRAKALLGYTPRVNLPEGLDSTLRWYQNALTTQTELANHVL